MKSNKKSKNKTDSSSSSSSDSESNNSLSSSTNSRASGSKSCEASSKKRKASNTSSKEYKHNNSLTRTTEEQFSKKSEDYRKYKKSRNDDRSNFDYHSQETDDKKDKYKRDVEASSSKHNENHSDRKKETVEKIRNESKYNKCRNKEPSRYDQEPSRYDHYDRSRNYHKSANARERTREGEERKFTSTEGSKSKNQYADNSRSIKYSSRNRRERSRSRSFDHANAQWGRSDQNSAKKEKGKPTEKQKPNFSLSGKLTEETNTYRGVVIKYSEPPEARKPKRRWRLYPFKGEKALQTLYIHRESAYLIGRDRKVVDLPVDHPSCSKQHAVLQYRLVSFTRDDGTAGKRVRPYIIDLESANGTYINNKKIDPKKYVELLEKDVIKFGFSSREYVLLHENSKDEAQDDDVKQEEEETKIKDEKEH